jgi:oligo-alginate lyase
MAKSIGNRLSLVKRSAACVAALVLSACFGSSALQSVAEPVVKATDAMSSAEARYDRMMLSIGATVLAQAEQGIDVPFPIDAGGGYTHEQHKQNAKTIYEAGLLYVYTGDVRYRDVARDVLLDYAALYPTLGIHPKKGNQSAGKLFWQGLNESVWLVYSIQGYAQIRDALSPEDRKTIEDGVLNPMADFLSFGSPETFDRIHNHGTWAAAAVGMTGYVLDQPDRVSAALMGLDLSGTGGFLAQLDQLFSPDGYYAEGPYYQRYALMPFVLFAQAIAENEPERKIFEYRDGILLKAIRSTIELSYGGYFFPINDAIREKGINTVELMYGLAIAYDLTGDPDFAAAAALQKGVVPTPEGLKLLRAIEAGIDRPFPFRTQLLRDGQDGTRGGLAILRSGPELDAATVLLKATTQGLGHGHFDKLGFVYYDAGTEVIADYGSARFLNVEPKYGGRYLPENESWAKQSVAHNVLVVDETSHFNGDWQEGQKFAPNLLAFGTMNGVAVSYAEIDTAYDGVMYRRLVAIVRRPGNRTAIVDIVEATSDEPHDFDLPVHFKGQFIDSSLAFTHSVDLLRPLGTKNGYQHLWNKGETGPTEDLEFLSWLIGEDFYTLSFAVDTSTRVVFVELGANDPDLNLRREQAFILRTQGTSTRFVSVYERHGRYDSDNEVTVYSGPSVSQITRTEDAETGRVKISFQDGQTVEFIMKPGASTPVVVSNSQSE